MAPARVLSVQEAVLGELFSKKVQRKKIVKSPPSGGRPGVTQRERAGLVGSARHKAQAVVKRVSAGGCKTRQELSRQLAYVAREEGVKALWGNVFGYPMEMERREIAAVAADWCDTWGWTPKRGHTDHLILSFPRGTDPVTAEAIARDWGEAVFAQRTYGDSWRYVAALHQDTDHVHAHFVVDKYGIENAKFLSISQRELLTLDVMRALQAEIAESHGLALTASRRLARGIIENPKRDIAVRIERAGGAIAVPPPLSDAERKTRIAQVNAYAEKYDALGRLAALSEGPAAGFVKRLSDTLFAASKTLREGKVIVSVKSILDTPADEPDSLQASLDFLSGKAREAWQSIQNQGPEFRTSLEETFAKDAAEAARLHPEDAFLRAHTSPLAREDDPYFTQGLAALHAVRRDAGLPLPVRAEADGLASGFHERLVDLLAQEPAAARAGIDPEILAARFLLAERTEGQLIEWHSAPTSAESVQRMEAERDFAERIELLAADASMSRPLLEAVAHKQLTMAEPSMLLLDIPAIEKLAELTRAAITGDEIGRVEQGDASALSREVADPLVRSAVAATIRYDAEVAADAGAPPPQVSDVLKASDEALVATAEDEYRRTRGRHL